MFSSAARVAARAAAPGPAAALVAAAAAAAALPTSSNGRRARHPEPARRAPEVHCDIRSSSSGFRRERRLHARDNSTLIRHTDFIYAVRGGKLDDSWILEKQLGSGAFGTVHLARHKTLDCCHAVKRIQHDPEDAEVKALLWNELHALMDLDHPNVVKLIQYIDEGPDLYLIFELCKGPDLFDRIRADASSGGMCEADAALAMLQMLKALKCCHDHYIGHFDIKPENFMYTKADLAHLKLIDLGLSSNFKRDSKDVKGSAPYMAPEVWDGVYGPEADIWSCGVVMFEMLTGTNFLGCPDSLKDYEVRRRSRDRAWVRQRLREAREQGKLSPQAQDLLSWMLRHDRHQRPTAREALRHPFVASADVIGLYPEEVVRQANSCLRDFPCACVAFASEPVFVRAVLLVMAHACAYIFEETRPQRLAFAIADYNSDGELSIEALEGHYLRSTGSVPANLERAFTGVDVNNDGYITYTEFLSATLPSSLQRDERLLREVFTILDTNGDGYIDAQDLSVPCFGGHDPEGICKAALADAGAVGPLGRLDWPRFLALMQEDRAARAHADRGARRRAGPRF